MLANILLIWAFVCLVIMLFKTARFLILYGPIAITIIVCLPVMPFVVAYKHRKKHPWQARSIVIGWSLIYLLLTFILYMES